jgi:hypothetical protein
MFLLAPAVKCLMIGHAMTATAMLEDMLVVALPVLTLWLAADASTLAAGPGLSSELNLGYMQMYDLQFAGAHQTFADYERVHPGDPLAPASDAAAHLFAEFDRLHVLQSEFFVHDDNFIHPKKLEADPAARKNFDADLDRAQKLAATVLSAKPEDPNALFASLLILGLRADFDGLIDKRYLSSLSSVKTSRTTAEKLLMVDPGFYDAHLAVGVENYMLSLKAAPIRWFLQLAGAEANRALGIARLRITAEKGFYLKPYARLLLAVAALRNQDRTQARDILLDLSRQFPHNRLYAEELGRLR